MYDLEIRNALIYDGSGKDSYYSNVTVTDGKIVYIGKDKHSAKHIVDADGLALAPGFIDCHSHSDQSIIKAPHRENALRMGVTTEIAGQCGHSISPDDGSMSSETRKSVNGSTLVALKDMPTVIDTVNRLELGTNQYYFTGHALLRGTVIGTEARFADTYEIERMQKMLEHEVKRGSAGMSTGLSYVPGIYSDTRELTMLAKTAGENGGMYVTHSRSESMGLFDSVQECIDIARDGNVAVNISHFKCVGKEFWGRCEKALSMIDAAISDGLNITLDAYPYIAASTTTLSAIPPQFLEKGVDAFAESLNNPDVVKAIYREIFEVNDPSWDNSIYYVGLENFLIVRAKETPWAIGKTYAQMGEELGMSPFDAMIQLLKANHGTVFECRFSMCEENVETILKHPKCMVGSDGIYLPGDLSAHPRAFGTFPRYLGHYIRKREILSREEGIRRITSMPAQTYGLKDKGRIAVGCDADLVLFDYDSITDNLDYTNPFKPNEGIYQVYVSGELVLENNELTGVFNGKYLRRERI